MDKNLDDKLFIIITNEIKKFYEKYNILIYNSFISVSEHNLDKSFNNLDEAKEIVNYYSELETPIKATIIDNNNYSFLINSETGKILKNPNKKFNEKLLLKNIGIDEKLFVENDKNSIIIDEIIYKNTIIFKTYVLKFLKKFNLTPTYIKKEKLLIHHKNCLNEEIHEFIEEEKNLQKHFSEKNDYELRRNFIYIVKEFCDVIFCKLCYYITYTDDYDFNFVDSDV